MKALVCTSPGELKYADIADPKLKAGHAIVRIRNICICGTDLHAFEGTQPFFSYPRILGHELSGELIEFDHAPGFQIGEHVTFLPYINCGNCIACRSGKTNCCANLKVCGVHIDGGMTDYYSIPTRLLVKAPGIDPYRNGHGGAIFNRCSWNQEGGCSGGRICIGDGSGPNWFVCHGIRKACRSKAYRFRYKFSSAGFL